MFETNGDRPVWFRPLANPLLPRISGSLSAIGTNHPVLRSRLIAYGPIWNACSQSKSEGSRAIPQPGCRFSGKSCRPGRWHAQPAGIRFSKAQGLPSPLGARGNAKASLRSLNSRLIRFFFLQRLPRKAHGRRQTKRLHLLSGIGAPNLEGASEARPPSANLEATRFFP